MTSEKSHRSRRSHDSKFKRWLHKVSTSRRAKRMFLNQVAIIVLVLLAFAIGYFYFGPSFSSSGPE